MEQSWIRFLKVFHSSCGIFQSMINAGTDTTAMTAKGIMAELMVHPDIKKQLQGEIDTVVGLNYSIQESDITNLLFQRAIIKKTFWL